MIKHHPSATIYNSTLAKILVEYASAVSMQLPVRFYLSFLYLELNFFMFADIHCRLDSVIYLDMC
jgi:hypothetical protein